jgi:hypothetical protein
MGGRRQGDREIEKWRTGVWELFNAMKRIKRTRRERRNTI